MRKAFFCIVIFIAMAMSGWAQVKAGANSIIVKGGINRSAMFDVKNKMGFLGGLELQHQLTKHHAVSIGAMYNMYKVEQDWNGDRDVSLNYISVPVMYNYYPVKGLCLKAGVEGNLLVHNHVNGRYGMCSYNTSYKELLEDQAYNRDTAKLNTVRFAVPIGISYEYSGIILDLRVEYGLNDVSSHDKIHYTMNALYATLGFRL